MQTYINDYLHTQKGLSIELATTVIMLFGVGCAIGVIAGGAAGQALYNWWVWDAAVGSLRVSLVGQQYGPFPFGKQYLAQTYTKDHRDMSAAVTYKAPPSIQTKVVQYCAGSVTRVFVPAPTPCPAGVAPAWQS
jgi:hypothetical protein